MTLATLRAAGRVPCRKAMRPRLRQAVRTCQAVWPAVRAARKRRSASPRFGTIRTRPVN